MKGFYSVLAFLLVYMLAVNTFVSKFMLTHKINLNVPDRNLFIFYGISIFLNVVGAVILTFYFFKKYFPDDDYYPKSITNPIILTILTIIVLRFIGLGL
jgi:formate hydrogenlyase subunit 3/multisubunit Na+/H+ antiporter MnhD subunit